MTFEVNRRSFSILLGGGLVAGCLSSVALAADSYPSQAISLVVPNSPGGPSDVVGRLVAEGLSNELKGSVVVENRPGGGGVVGTTVVIESPPNGYTLLFSSNAAFSVVPALRNDLPFDVSKDMVVVGTVAWGPEALFVRSSLGVNTVDELIQRAKAEPGDLKFATAGPGSVIHMAGEMFKHEAGIDITAIPYGGGGQAVAAMLGGEVDMMVNDLSAVVQYLEDGSIKALAVSSEKRLPEIPDTPTFAEVGLPTVDVSSWFAIGAPAATPPEVLETFRAALKKVVGSDRFKERLTQFGLEPFDLPEEEATKFIAGELAKWKKLVADADIKLE